MSRIRQIKPSWFLDKKLRRGTTAEVREFYIGLWMLADDAGYLVWDVERIAAELYPYEHVDEREARVIEWADVLNSLDPDAPHLLIWSCGHARVPKMPEHQRISGKQTFTVAKIHVGDHTSPPPDKCRRATVSQREPTSDDVSPGNGREIRTVGNVTVGNGSASEFQEKVPRLVALGGEG